MEHETAMNADAKPSDTGSTRRVAKNTYFRFDGKQLKEIGYTCGPRCHGRCEECAIPCPRRKQA